MSEQAAGMPANLKILFVSLGCDKNLVDSEHMLGTLAGHGYEMTDDEEDADIIIRQKRRASTQSLRCPGTARRANADA